MPKSSDENRFRGYNTLKSLMCVEYNRLIISYHLQVYDMFRIAKFCAIENMLA